MQVISHTPGVEPSSLEICIAANDELYRAVESDKSRYAGFAMLPMNDPPAAATKLERCVHELGFVGTLVPNHAYGRYYDVEYFWPVFSAVQKLDVPISLHPTLQQSRKDQTLTATIHQSSQLYYRRMVGAGIPTSDYISSSSMGPEPSIAFRA